MSPNRWRCRAPPSPPSPHDPLPMFDTTRGKSCSPAARQRAVVFTRWPDKPGRERGGHPRPRGLGGDGVTHGGGRTTMTGQADRRTERIGREIAARDGEQIAVRDFASSRGRGVRGHRPSDDGRRPRADRQPRAPRGGPDVAAGAYNVTEHATFLGLEGWQIRVTVTLLGLVPTVTLLLIGWDDVDALWMVVRTRRLKRRQQYRALARGEHGASTRHGQALPSPDHDGEKDTSA